MSPYYFMGCLFAVCNFCMFLSCIRFFATWVYQGRVYEFQTRSCVMVARDALHCIGFHTIYYRTLVSRIGRNGNVRFR